MRNHFKDVASLSVLVVCIASGHNLDALSLLQRETGVSQPSLSHVSDMQVAARLSVMMEYLGARIQNEAGSAGTGNTVSRVPPGSDGPGSEKIGWEPQYRRWLHCAVNVIFPLVDQSFGIADAVYGVKANCYEDNNAECFPDIANLISGILAVISTSWGESQFNCGPVPEDCARDPGLETRAYHYHNEAKQKRYAYDAELQNSDSSTPTETELAKELWENGTKIMEQAKHWRKKANDEVDRSHKYRNVVWWTTLYKTMEAIAGEVASSGLPGSHPGLINHLCHHNNSDDLAGVSATEGTKLPIKPFAYILLKLLGSSGDAWESAQFIPAAIKEKKKLFYSGCDAALGFIHGALDIAQTGLSVEMHRTQDEPDGWKWACSTAIIQAVRAPLYLIQAVCSHQACEKEEDREDVMNDGQANGNSRTEGKWIRRQKVRQLDDEKSVAKVEFDNPFLKFDDESSSPSSQ